MTKFTSLCCALVFGLNMGVQAQVLNPKVKEEVEDGVMEGPIILQDVDGYTFVWNEGKTHFTFELRGEGKEVKFVEEVRFFYIGKTMIQLKVIPFELVKVKLEEGQKLEDENAPQDIPFAQCYLTIVDNESIILMNSFIMKKEDAGTAEAFLLKHMDRIQFSDKPVNFIKVQEGIVEKAKKLQKK